MEHWIIENENQERTEDIQREIEYYEGLGFSYHS